MDLNSIVSQFSHLPELMQADYLLSVLSAFSLMGAGWLCTKSVRIDRRRKAKQMKTSATWANRMRLKLRFYRTRQFTRIGDSVAQDACAMLYKDNQTRYQAKTLLPLLVEVRRLGEKLLVEQNKVHQLIDKKLESEIGPMIARLSLVEQEIRSIPKSAFTIEEVVAGEFKCIS